MSYKVELPPQPDPRNFGDGERKMYYEALAAWERVCKQIIERVV